MNTTPNQNATTHWRPPARVDPGVTSAGRSATHDDISPPLGAGPDRRGVRRAFPKRRGLPWLFPTRGAARVCCRGRVSSLGPQCVPFSFFSFTSRLCGDNITEVSKCRRSRSWSLPPGPGPRTRADTRGRAHEATRAAAEGVRQVRRCLRMRRTHNRALAIVTGTHTCPCLSSGVSDVVS